MRSTSAPTDPVAELAHDVTLPRQVPEPEERRRIREAAGASIRRCARAAGVAPATFHRWERSEELSIEQALRYTPVLEVLRAAADDRN